MKGCSDCKVDHESLATKNASDAVKLRFRNKAKAEKKYGKVKH